MDKHAIAAALALLSAAPTQPTPAPVSDGRVTGLNADAYGALKAVKQRNPGSLTEKDAQEVAAGVQKDKKLDNVERDLLAEMTQSQFRNIRVTPAGARPDGADMVMTFPTVGNAKRVLLYILNPELDLDAAWAKPDHDWRLIVNDYRTTSARQPKIQAFVAGELAKKWGNSTMGNAYKPLRDEIARLYGLSNAPGTDASTGRTLLYKAMEVVDRSASDGVPDFLYNWVRPGGTL